MNATADDKPSNDEPLRVPEEALRAIDEDVSANGGPVEPDPESAGSIGRTMFDTPASEDGTVTVILPKQSIGLLPHQSLVRIKSIGDGRSYLGAVVKGPFAEPDGLRGDSAVVVTATAHGAILMPRYHGRVQVELMWEELASGGVIPPKRRPLPNSPVFPLAPDEAARTLKTSGNMLLGLAHGQDGIEARFPSDSKGVLPKHLGILGTTGGGKSTTVSGMVAQLQKAGVSSVVLDTEGEYTAINQPTIDGNMKEALQKRGQEPSGVADTHVLYLVNRDPSNPQHPDCKSFSLRFSELSPYAVMEILDLSEAQQERFLKAYDLAKLCLERLKIYPATDEDKEHLLEIDEFETGYPKMTLGHVYDMAKMLLCHVSKDDEFPYLETKTFYEQREQIKTWIDQLQKSIPGNTISWKATVGRIGRVRRLNIFDSQAAPPFDYEAILQPGRVTVIDLGDTDSPQVNNLVIAQLLRGLQRQQDANYRESRKTGAPPRPAVVFIEEAHEFLSSERIKQMQILFQQVARIARRGRKRWLGLAFITQLPQHLPDEVLGLINNWVLHKITDANVVGRLRRSIGGIDESLWSQLPSLAPGQAIVSFTNIARPLLITVDPTPCRLLMVE